MHKSVAILSVGAALTFGACSSAENDDTAPPIPERVLEEHAQLADKLAQTAMGDFLGKLAIGASVQVDIGNCLYFEAMDGAATVSVVQKDPVQYTFKQNDATVVITPFGKGDADNGELHIGLYTYTDEVFKDTPIIVGDVSAMKPEGPGTQLVLTETNGDGNTFWFVGSHGEHIAQTEVISHTSTDTIDTARVNEAALKLCGDSPLKPSDEFPQQQTA